MAPFESRPMRFLAAAMVTAVFVAGCGGGLGDRGGGGSSAVAPSSGAPGVMAAEDSTTGKVEGAASQAASPNGAPEAHASEDLFGRTIIRNGSLELEVESVAEAYDRVSAIATGAGGYVQDGSFFGGSTIPVSDGVVREERTARLTLRVPAERYDEVVANLRRVAKEVRAAGMQTRDATAEVTDLDATLRNLRAVEAQYVQLLGRAQAINDILLVQDKLRQVRLEIERADSRRAVLSKLSDLATISVQLAPVPLAPERVVDTRNPLHAADAAWDASLATLRTVASVLVAVLVFSWWLVPFIAVGTYVGMRVARTRRPATATPLEV